MGREDSGKILGKRHDFAGFARNKSRPQAGGFPTRFSRNAGESSGHGGRQGRRNYSGSQRHADPIPRVNKMKSLRPGDFPLGSALSRAAARLLMKERRDTRKRVTLISNVCRPGGDENEPQRISLRDLIVDGLGV